MSSRGWIKLHRRIQDHWIYQEKRSFSRYEAWLDLIMLANHEDKKILMDGELATVEKGSFITSKRKLCIRWEWSNTKVDKFLNLLASDDMITHKSDTKKTVITIVKYEVYHDERKEKRHRNETETKQKHNRNETETDKQELKELKELKEPISTTVENDAIVFYQNNFGMIRPNIAEEILDYINDFGDEIVIESLKRSLDRNKPNWAYARSILNSWQSKNIKTMDQIKAEDVEFQNQQKQRFNNYKPRPEEKLPDWYEKHQQEVAQVEAKKEQQRQQNTNQNEDEVVKELDDLINSVKRGG